MSDISHRRKTSDFLNQEMKNIQREKDANDPDFQNEHSIHENGGRNRWDRYTLVSESVCVRRNRSLKRKGHIIRYQDPWPGLKQN